MIIKAKLRVIVPHVLRNGRSPADIWDLLTGDGRLAPLKGRSLFEGAGQYQRNSWGTLQNGGTFLALGLTKTRDGFECELRLKFEGFDESSPGQQTEWFKENLFCGQKLKVRGQGDRGYNFRPSDIGVTFIVEDITGPERS